MKNILSDLHRSPIARLPIPFLFLCGFLNRSACGIEPIALDHPTKMAEFRDQIGETLRSEATVSSTTDHQQSLIQLCDWYAFIRSHREFDDFPLMQAESTKIRNRLLRSKRKLSNRLKREGIDRPDGLSEAVESKITQTLAHRTESGNSKAKELWRSTGASAGTGFDTGWQLVELISRTIDPNAWKSNGGDATMTYLATKRVLVVSATTQTHEELEAFLNALR